MPGQPIGGFDFRTQANQRWQSIYYPSNFSSAPAGAMSNLYVRSGGVTSGSSVTYYDLTVKIGYTTKSKFPHVGLKDSFLTGLTTVFYASTVTLPGADSAGKWIKIPFNTGNFFYDPHRNFVVEISHGAMPLNGIVLLTDYTNPDYRGAGGGPNPEGVSYTQAMELGFDLATTGIREVDKLQDFDMYPNPAKGFVAIEVGSQTMSGEINVTISNVIGQQMLNHQFKRMNPNFSAELDLSGIPKGVYLVQIRNGQKLISKKLYVE